MKKSFALFIVVVMMVGICACGSKAADTKVAKDDSFAAAVESEKEATDNTIADALSDDADAQETEVSADRIMPEGLVDIYVSAGNVADFVFHADKSGIEDIKTIAYRFGEYEISLSDFGAGYQSSTWNVSDSSSELAEEEDYIIDGSNYVIKAYITSIVPCFDTMDGTYELYYESKDGETYYYNLVWKDVVKQGVYEEGNQAGDSEGNMTFADIPSGEYVGETQSNGDCSSFYFSSEGSGTYSTQFRLKNGDAAIIDNIDITPELVVDNGSDYVVIMGSNGSMSYAIAFYKNGEAKARATNTDGLTINDTLHVK